MHILHSIPSSAHTWCLPPTLGVFLYLVLAVEDTTWLSTFTQVRYSDSGMDRNWGGVAEILQQNSAVEKVCSSAGSISLATSLHIPLQLVSYCRTRPITCIHSTQVLFVCCCLFVVVCCCLFVFPTRCIVNEVRVIVPTPIWEVDSLNLDHTK